MSPLNLALNYISETGWGVFPCRPADDFDHVTGEIYSAKSPLTSNGLRGASKNERIVREWFENRYPSALIGSPTGEAMGAWVLDVDVKPGVGDGFEWVRDMEDLHGKLPKTASVSTPRGGRHYYFKYAPGIRNRGNLGHCIDVRGEGGFVVLAGSVMADGRAYEWVDGIGPEAIADTPDWLLQLLLPPVHTATRHDYTYQPGGNDIYVERAVEAELRLLATTGPGGRGYQLNASAFSLGTMVGSGALSRSEAEAGLYQAASACGVLAKDGERETMAKIRRGLAAGERQPRDIPEASHANDNTRLVDISRMITNGLAKGKKDGTQEASNQADPERDESDLLEPEDADVIPIGISSAPAEQPAFVATPFQWIDPKTLARREFAFGTHYIRKYVSVTVSPGGLGKTSNSIVEAISMGAGKALLGVKPPQRLKVWLFNAEDPRDEMERRIMAACIHYRLSPKDIEGHLFLDTGREQELVVAIDDKRGVKIQVPVVEAVVEQITRNGIDVMIVDPFVSTHQVNENDNGAIDKVAKLWAQIADRTNCSIDIVHHLRKVADRDATVEDARGAVSLIGAARSVRVLNRMSEEQAGQAGISAQERFSYFNVHQGKSNLTKMSSAQDWRKLESVPLGNGQGLSKPQDHAGVVTEWKWPSAEEAVGEVAADQLQRVLVAVRNGDHKLHAAADTWVGRVVAYELGLDMAVKADKARVTRLVKAWIDDGTLVVVNRKCPIKRENKDFVEAPYAPENAT